MNKSNILILIFFLLIYINRCFFISPLEVENQQNNELNSVIEWALEYIVGKSNNIDEDGDVPTNCSYTKHFPFDFMQQLLQINLFSKEIKKIKIPYTDFALNNFYKQIDQPPELI